MTELTPEKLREAADVVAAYAFDRREKDPSFRMVDAEILRVAANRLEAENAERDREIEELVNDMYPTDHLSVRERATRLYDAGWRKQ